MRNIILCALLTCTLAVLLMSTRVNAATSQARPAPLVVLISIDGFRADYLARGVTPTLSMLARRGARAKGLEPSFPSVTFPNHYSIVTGLYPDHHGIVNNSMTDPQIPNPTFALSIRAAVTNPLWWQEGTPVWVTAARQGKISSTLFWPGTEVKIQDIQPRDWLPYKDEMTSAERTKHLLGWLRHARPRADFATLYFSEVDTAGHLSGPDSREVNQAMGRVDAAIARLLKGLRALGIRKSTTLVIVSDHGMAPTNASRIIDLHDLPAEVPGARISWTGAFAGIDVEATDPAPALEALARREHMACWPKERIPERFHFGHHRRIPRILCLAGNGWTIVTDPTRPVIPGLHGFDPGDENMRGLFIAQGPQIRTLTLPVTRNIDVYPLLCALLGIKEEPNDASHTLRDEILK